MTVFYSHHDSVCNLRRGASRPHAISVSWPLLTSRLRVLTRRAVGRILAACRMAHRGIVNAKTRRLEREPTIHEIPRCPIVLGDKWDF